MDQQEFYDEIYTHCRCDPGRRKETSLDGYTLQCGKCIICGRYGHFRIMPGIQKKFSAGWCEFHYAKLAAATERQTSNAFATACQNPEAAAHLICGRDMGTEHYAGQVNAFLARKHPYQFYNDLDDLLCKPSSDSLAAFMKHMPINLPFGENVKLKKMFLKKRRREFDSYQRQFEQDSR